MSESEIRLIEMMSSLGIEDAAILVCMLPIMGDEEKIKELTCWFESNTEISYESLLNKMTELCPESETDETGRNYNIHYLDNDRMFGVSISADNLQDAIEQFACEKPDKIIAEIQTTDTESGDLKVVYSRPDKMN